MKYEVEPSSRSLLVRKLLLKIKFLVIITGYSCLCEKISAADNSVFRIECSEVLKREIFLDRHFIQLVKPKVFLSTHTEAYRTHFFKHGFVVVDGVSNRFDREKVIARIDEIAMSGISNTRRLGFMDLYHDDSLAQLRQNESLVRVFQSLLGTEKIWSVFDRVLYSQPNDSEQDLPPHVDQNPIKQPSFSNIQAILALKTMNEETGTLALIPQSHLSFDDYKLWTKPEVGHVEYAGELVLSFIAPVLSEGQIVIWDSRLTHSRYKGKSTAKRYGALLSFIPAKDEADLVNLRLQHLSLGTGWNHHGAGLRATAKPRYDKSLRKTSENLTELGKKIYGLKSWFNHE